MGGTVFVKGIKKDDSKACSNLVAWHRKSLAATTSTWEAEENTNRKYFYDKCPFFIPPEMGLKPIMRLIFKPRIPIREEMKRCQS